MAKPRVDGMERLKALQAQRDAFPLPKRVGEMFNGTGHLHPEFQEHRPAERALRAFHRKSAERAMELNGEYERPLIVGLVLKEPMRWTQLTHRYPFKVVWFRDGKRFSKNCHSIWDAVLLHKKLVAVVPNATIVSRARPYDIPPSLRNRLPKPWVWCPYCCKPRKYQRTDQKIHVLKKKERERGGYEMVDIQVWLTFCTVCRGTNKDPIYRRSNQRWTVRRFKQGARRAKKR